MDIVTAIIGMSGVALGSFISFLFQYFLSNHGASLKIRERIISRKFEAYEALLKIPQSLRTSTNSNPITEINPNEIARLPRILITKAAFEKWIEDFSLLVNEHLHWIPGDLAKEIYLIQDYLHTLWVITNNTNDEELQNVGVIIASDFIELADSFAKKADRYFENEIRTMRAFPFRKEKGQHKYASEITTIRLNQFILFIERDRITNIIQS